MGAEQPFEGLSLRIAQVRKLRRNVTDRAVMLTQLRATLSIVGDCGVAIVRETLRQDVELSLRRCTTQGTYVSSHHVVGALLREPAHGGVPTLSAQVAQSADSKIVVCHIEGVTALIGERKHAGRAASPPCGGWAERPPLRPGDVPHGRK